MRHERGDGQRVEELVEPEPPRQQVRAAQRVDDAAGRVEQSADQGEGEHLEPIGGQEVGQGPRPPSPARCRQACTASAAPAARTRGRPPPPQPRPRRWPAGCAPLRGQQQNGERRVRARDDQEDVGVVDPAQDRVRPWPPRAAVEHRAHPNSTLAVAAKTATATRSGRTLGQHEQQRHRSPRTAAASPHAAAPRSRGGVCGAGPSVPSTDRSRLAYGCVASRAASAWRRRAINVTWRRGTVSAGALGSHSGPRLGGGAAGGWAMGLRGLLYGAYERRLAAALNAASHPAAHRRPGRRQPALGPRVRHARQRRGTAPAPPTCSSSWAGARRPASSVVTLWLLSTDNLSRPSAELDAAAARSSRTWSAGSPPPAAGGCTRSARSTCCLPAGQPAQEPRGRHPRRRRTARQRGGRLRRTARDRRRRPLAAAASSRRGAPRSRSWPRCSTSSTSPSTCTPAVSPTPTW